MTRNLLVLLTLLFVTVCDGRDEHGPQRGDSGPAEFVSNGERIYFTGSSASGIPINAIGSNHHHMSTHMGANDPLPMRFSAIPDRNLTQVNQTGPDGRTTFAGACLSCYLKAGVRVN